MTTRKENIFSILFVLLMILSIAGSAFRGIEVGGFSIYGFRILLLGLSGYFGYRCFKDRPREFLSGLDKTFLFAIVSFLILGLVSYFKVEDPILFVKEIVYWALALIIILNVLCFRFYLPKKKIKDLIFNGLLTLFLVLTVFAIIEYQNYVHLDTRPVFVKEMLEKDPGRLIYAPYFSFGNPNNLTFYLAFITGIILVYYRDKRKSYGLLFVSVSYFISIMTSSRSVQICLLLFIPIILISNWEQIKNSWRTIAVILSCSLFIIVINGVSKPSLADYQEDNEKLSFDSLAGDSILLFNDTSEFFVQEGATETEEEADFFEDSSSSNSIRKNLILNSIDAGKKYFFTGSGSGQFNHYLASPDASHFVKGANNAHGLLIMVFANYGIPGLLILGLLVFFWCRAIVRKYRTWKLRLFHFLFIMVLILNSFGPSEYIQLPYVWHLIALYLILFHLDIESKIEES